MEPLDEVTARRLLAFARASIRACFDGTVPEAPELPAELATRRPGIFVTIKKAGDLRGCIGHIRGRLPLAYAVPELAKAAAFEDPRFRPMAPGELDHVRIEISLLSTPEPVASWEDIVLGRHGIVLEAQGQRAVFLPQVATEQGWTLKETLEALSWKAGLPRDAWQQPGAHFEVFEALHVEEAG